MKLVRKPKIGITLKYSGPELKKQSSRELELDAAPVVEVCGCGHRVLVSVVKVHGIYLVELDHDMALETK